MSVPTGLSLLCLCRSMSPHSDLPRSPVIYQKINFEQIAPHCPDTIPAPQQALVAFRGLSPSVPWPPCPGGPLCTTTALKPTDTQVLRAHQVLLEPRSRYL